MVEKYSDLFHVTHRTLVNQGAFDAFVNIDSRLHVDPFLLRSTNVPELCDSYHGFTQYFERIIQLLKASRRQNDRMFRQAVNLLVFPELANVSLGYSKSGSSGSGIGRILATKLTNTAKEIIDAGIEDPQIFELVGLIEGGIGADRISDMTIRIILPDLLTFSERVAANLSIRTHSFTYENTNYRLPQNPTNNQAIILIPNDLLRILPVAHDWSDIDVVCAHNEQLRRIVNRIIGGTWKYAISKVRKSELRTALLDYPELFRDLLDNYSAKRGSAYNITADPAGLFSWEQTAREYSTRYPLALTLDDNPTPEQLLSLVRTICSHFKTLVEDNGLNRLLYRDGENLQHESHAQLLLYAIADSYCTSNDIDITREANGGRGPVDFKFSHGNNAKVTVEVKYSSNPHLFNGYTEQLPTYNQAERSQYSIYLIIQTKRADRKIRDLTLLRDEREKRGERVPEIFVVDGTIHPSASRMRA